MSPRDQERYSRQILFQGIGAAGQRKLLDASVVVVGCGALGTFQAGALARAGVGKIRIIDRDYVEISNLQRQWLFEESDAEAGLPKAVAAARALGRINSSIAVEGLVDDLSPTNAIELLDGAAVILDATDNFETRFLINDYAVSQGVPWIYGAAVGSYGITMSILPKDGACFACVYPEPPSGSQPTCETNGVLGSTTSAIASLQTAAALRLLCGETPAETITTLDVWTGEIRGVPMPQRDPQCRVCARGDYAYLNGEHQAPVSLCGRNAVQIHEKSRPLDLAALSERLKPLGTVRSNEFALRFEIPPYLLTVFPDGRAIVKGTNDVGVARSIYARYIGG